MSQTLDLVFFNNCARDKKGLLLLFLIRVNLAYLNTLLTFAWLNRSRPDPQTGWLTWWKARRRSRQTGSKMTDWLFHFHFSCFLFFSFFLSKLFSCPVDICGSQVVNYDWLTAVAAAATMAAWTAIISLSTAVCLPVSLTFFTEQDPNQHWLVPSFFWISSFYYFSLRRDKGETGRKKMPRSIVRSMEHENSLSSFLLPSFSLSSLFFLKSLFNLSCLKIARFSSEKRGNTEEISFFLFSAEFLFPPPFLSRSVWCTKTRFPCAKLSLRHNTTAGV